MAAAEDTSVPPTPTALSSTNTTTTSTTTTTTTTTGTRLKTTIEPTGTTTTGTPSTTTTRRRAKSFLRNYYGIQQTDTANPDGSKEGPSMLTGPNSKADPYDLDSHGFEVDKYMHKMFVEKQLPGLVQADNELVADIRQLDGDMKTLVYENYSKFLSATETINKMKSNVDNLESEMSRLTQNINKIATSSAAIHSSLGTKREKIRQLNGVHSLLTKLQFVFELPANLHQFLETESYTQAVKSYCRTLHLLQHYKHLAVFTGIERECKTIMVEIAHRIRQKMSADQATLTEITECVGLLLALKESPVPLWKQYLHLSMRYLQKTKTKALEDIDTLPLYAHPSPSAQQQEQQPTPKTTPKKTLRKSSKSSGTSKEPKAFPKPLRTQSSASLLSLPAADKISYLNVNYLKHVEGFVVSFQNYFLAPISLGTNSNNISTSSTATTAVTVAASEQEKEEKKEITHVTEQQRQHPAWITKDSSVHANLTSDQREEASEAVKTAISETISQYLDIINSFLDFPEDISSIRSEVHIHVLQNLYSASLSSNGLCNMIGFDTLASGLIQDWETKLIRQALGKIKDELMTRISIQDLTGRVRSQQQENLLDTPSGDLSSTVKNITSTSPTITAATTTTTATKNTSLASVLKETTQWLHDVFKNDTIPFLENCMSSDAQFLETKEGRASFLKNFQDSFKESFWEQVLKEMQQKSLSLTSPATTSIPIPSSLPVSTSASPSTAASTSRNKDSLLPLVMSHLCFQFSNGFVEQLYKVLSKTLFRPGKRSRPDSFLIESFEQPLVVIPQLARDCKAVAQSCQETGHVLLDGFVARTGNELSWLVMDMDMKMDMQHSFLMDGDGGGTIGDTATSQTPASVSETWERVYRYLNDIEHQVMMVYGDEGDDRLGNHEISSESIRRESGFKSLGGRGGHGYGHGGGGGDGSGSNNDNSGRLSNRNESLTSFGSNTMNTMNNNNTRLFENQQRNLLLSHIDKLFSDRVDIFVRCQDLNRTGIMFGIVKILLKAWAESVRLRTYGRRSFQQIQVDAEFAKVWLWRFATADERLMYSLLEETQQTAYRRCFDPIPLDMNTIESIINSTER